VANVIVMHFTVASFLGIYRDVDVATNLCLVLCAIGIGCCSPVTGILNESFSTDYKHEPLDDGNDHPSITADNIIADQPV